MAEIQKFEKGWISGGKINKFIVSSKYNHVRNKKGGGTRLHKGIDISIPVDTPIYMPFNGTAQCRFQGSAAGLYLMLTTNTGVYSNYCFLLMHLHSVNGLTKGQSKKFKKGELIAYSGGAKGDPNAGSSTGPHLHFEVRNGSITGSSIDPTVFFSDTLVDRNGNSVSKGVEGVKNIETNDNSDNSSNNTTEINEKRSDQEIVLAELDSTATEIEVAKTETEVTQTEVAKINGNVKAKLARGIWQITKLFVDGNVADLRLYDVATSIQSGSLISFFNKVCQKPFAEFMGDTFKDQYYFIVRKPPFDKEGMLKVLDSQNFFKLEETDKGKIKKESDFGSSMYDIQSEDIINTNLSFDYRDIYSWYQFYPIYEMGSPSDLRYIIPAVLFPEYAAIYGSRELSIQSQYRSFNKSFIKDELNDNNKSKQGDYEVRHSIHDLKYIIESNAYNPFTRSGTIQIAGNRRIKRGVFIRIEAYGIGSKEIFYVDGVSHNYSVTSSGVNRTTTLYVSHGMIQSYMFDSETINNEEISYFNLINFGNYDKYKNNLTMDSWAEIISSWKVNINIFHFFLKKMQFISETLATNQAEVVVKRKKRNKK